MNCKVLVSTLIICLAGCSREVPYLPPPPPATASAADATPTVNDKVFSITLLDPVCAEGAAPTATAVAKWDVGPLKATAITIHVESPGNEKKLWLEGGATGEEKTGAWVFEKSRFHLQDKDSGKVLAMRLVDAIPCAP